MNEQHGEVVSCVSDINAYNYDVIYKGFTIFLYFGILTHLKQLPVHIMSIRIIMSIMAFLDCCKTIENDW